MSVRAAIGADRRRLLQQLLVEGLVLGLAGVVVAVAVAWSLVRLLLAIELPKTAFAFTVLQDERPCLARRATRHALERGHTDGVTEFS